MDLLFLRYFCRQLPDLAKSQNKSVSVSIVLPRFSCSIFFILTFFFFNIKEDFVVLFHVLSFCFHLS